MHVDSITKQFIKIIKTIGLVLQVFNINYYISCTLFKKNYLNDNFNFL